MNLFQLIFKQMRQRSLSTFLTCLSVLLGMALATSITVTANESRAIFAQSDYGFNLLAGPKGSGLQFVLNTIYHMGVSPGNIPYHVYEDLTGRPVDENGKPNLFRGRIAWAVPYAVGDSYKGRRIVGTTTNLFGVDNESGQPLEGDKLPEYRVGQSYSIAQGRVFAPNKFEAVIGSEVAQNAGLKLGDEFHATHGFPGPSDTPDIHEEIWKVVGVLNETHTANDRALFIPLMTFYAIFEHEEGELKASEIKVLNERGAPASAPAETKPGEKPQPAASPAATTAAATEEPEEKAYTMNPDGTITVKLPKADWEISAVLIKTRGAQGMIEVPYILRNLPDATGVNPAQEMEKFFDLFLPKVSLVLLVISTLVMVVAGVSILVSIYNSVTARNREIAIMRALGATRVRILTVVCLEAGIVGAMGGVLGIIAGHLLAAAGSLYLEHLMGTAIPWWHISWVQWGPAKGLQFWWPVELLYLLAVIAVSLLAGLVPALKAYGTPVAENLVSG